MARQNRVQATQLTSIAGTETAFQNLANDADLIVEINPGAVHHVMFKEDSSGTTDSCRFRFFVTNKDIPGAVPDSARALAGSDWGVLQDILLDSGEALHENVWQDLLIAGYRFWACSVVRPSGTDTFTCDLNYSDDGINS
jgi:hypothetical protein